jgi:hypothetical protein
MACLASRLLALGTEETRENITPSSNHIRFELDTVDWR